MYDYNSSGPAPKPQCSGNVVLVAYNLMVLVKRRWCSAVKPGFHSNAIACVVCVACVVNENRKKRKRLRWQAANHGRHCFDWAFLLAGACVFTQQTQAPANRNAQSKQWRPWLAACQRNRLRFLRFLFTQRTQRKRLRLNGNRVLGLR